MTAQATETVQATELSLLEQAIGATKQTERSEAEVLMKTLVDEALAGTVTWNNNLTGTIESAINSIDALLSAQLIEILHDPELQQLEGSWRGLHYLVKNNLCSTELQIKVLNASKKVLARNLEKAVEFDQSDLFKKSMKPNMAPQVVAPLAR